MDDSNLQLPKMVLIPAIIVLLQSAAALATTPTNGTVTPSTSTTSCPQPTLGGPEVQPIHGIIVTNGCGGVSTIPIHTPDFPIETSHANGLCPDKHVIPLLLFGILSSTCPFIA
ncbi:hypothetical protein BJX66DRAFT_312648 [Aspergillus keveii]|uniref:Uncharacterized protein n=1 Tax=Aspergillus keveii TaxID=714993 RepID=A0ABR4FTB0_9EURO